MMVHEAGAAEKTVLIVFFVAAPGHDGIERGAELVPVPVHFDAEIVQTFYVGPASCGVPGTPAGLERALRRFGSLPISTLATPAIGLAREGAPVNAEQAYILDILWPIHERSEGTRELYAPGGKPVASSFVRVKVGSVDKRLAVHGDRHWVRGSPSDAKAMTTMPRPR